MSNIIHFNMLVEINNMLKSKGIEYSIHSIGGCISAGLYLQQDGKEYPCDKIVLIINDYLNNKWMKVVPKSDNPSMLDVISKFQ